MAKSRVSGAVSVTDDDWVFDALGTRWEITTDRRLPESVRDEVRAEIERIDVAWSRFRADSMVSRMAVAAGVYPVARCDQRLLDWYRTLYDLSDGAVTPLVGQLLSDAGYDAQYSLRVAPELRPVPAWSDVIAEHRNELRLRVPALLDVGAAGKGFAVDQVAGIVAGYTDRYLVDASGDMLISPRDTPVRIALEHPLNPRMAIGVFECRGGAVCASASNRRAWADWHHIVHPHSASPAREVLATWVMAPDAMTADGLATALFFVPGAQLRTHLSCGDTSFDHVTIRRNGSAEHTAPAGLELFL
ncbi:MAG: FAD:protein FMN transferase [Gordonia sp. (in: high G+C Gram-positive bacteria)]